MGKPRTSGLLLALASLLFHVQVASATATYCSSQNTAGGDALSHTWQSNGWCTDQCKSEYAFAIVQNLNCWCSNYVPADQTDTGDCNQNCPGFPEEKCGNESEGLFGYIAIPGAKPSGTQGASQPTSAQVSPSSNPVVPAVPSSTADQATTANPSEEPSSAAPTTFRTSTSSPSVDQPGIGGSGATSLRVVTVSDVNGNPNVVTQTVIYTPTSAPSVAQIQKKTPVGTIVGGVLGGLALLAATVGAVFFVLWRRRRQQQQDADADDPSGVHRNTSTMSKAGLLRSEKTTQYPPNINTASSRHSRIMHDTNSISPVSDRRSSRPYIFDQRLNPSAIMTMDNASRASVASMDDARDYGRTLNVRNPDPDPQ